MVSGLAGKVLLRSCSRVERREGLDLLQRAADIRIHLLGPEHPLTRDLEPRAAFQHTSTAFKKSHSGLQQSTD